MITIPKFMKYLLAWVLLFGFYVLTQPQVLSLAHDAIGILGVYDAALQTGITWEWFPAFYFLNRFFTLSVLSVFTWFGVSVFQGVLLFNAAFSSLAVIGFWRLSRQGLQLSAGWSFGLAAVLGSSFGVWGYMNTVEVYALSFCVAIWVLGVVLSLELRRRNILILGVLVGLSALFHIAYVFLGFCVLARLTRKSDAGIFFLVSSAVFLVPLLLTGDLLNGLHSEAGVTYAVGWMSPVYVLIGMLRVFVGGHFLMSEYFWERVLHGTLPLHHLADEFFLVRHASVGLIRFLTGVFVFFVGFLCVLLGLWLRSFSKMWREKQPILKVLLAGLLSFTALAVYADPVPVDQYMFHSVFLLGLLGLMLSSYSRYVACSLGVLNYAGSMQFLRSMTNDYFYHHYQDITDLSAKNTLVIYDFDFYYQNYHRWLKGPQEVLYLNTTSLETLRSAIQMARNEGRPILLHPNAVRVMPYLQHRYGVDPEQISAFWRSYGADFQPVQSKDGSIYYQLL
jgi:uncharacterized membrane protein